MSLISLEAAKLAAHILDPAQDAEVTMFLERASARIVSYLAEFGDPDWDETTAPKEAQQMTSLLFAYWWTQRGDAAPDAVLDPWPAIARLADQLRDPAFA